MTVELPVVRQNGRRYPRAHVRRGDDLRWKVTTELRPGIFVSEAGTTTTAATSFITWPSALHTAHQDISQLRRYQEAPGVGDPL